MQHSLPSAWWRKYNKHHEDDKEEEEEAEEAAIGQQSTKNGNHAFFAGNARERVLCHKLSCRKLCAASDF